MVRVSFSVIVVKLIVDAHPCNLAACRRLGSTLRNKERRSSIVPFRPIAVIAPYLGKNNWPNQD